MATHAVPGQHVYEGMALEAAVPDHIVEQMKDMRAVEGDIIIATYPKAGTTWTQEIVWLMENNFDVAEAKNVTLWERSVFLEHNGIPTYNGKTGYEIVENRTEPAVMKTHLPAWIFNKQIQDGKIKFIVVIRNPKDLLVSLYHFYRSNMLLGSFTGTWDEFFQLYQSKGLTYGDYFDWYESWVKYLDRSNVKLISYEDMKMDFSAIFDDLCAFLGTNVTEEQKKLLLNETSFRAMKEHVGRQIDEKIPIFNKNEPMFFRKGEVGDWKNYFSKEQNEHIEQQYETRLKNKGIVIKYE